MPLIDRIKSEILKDGPISVDRYMELCLYDSKKGYYFSKDILGRDGDFITSPEVTQIFGELLALLFVHQWMLGGERKPVQLIECGPGKGTLMHDMLRILQKYPNLYNNLSIHLVEVSPLCKALQELKLKPHAISFHNNIEDAPYCEGFTFIVANEFFDALPIKQFYKNEEQRITLNDREKLSFTLKDSDTISINDNLVEDCPSYKNIMDSINKRLLYAPGALLIIDYGDEEEERFGSTLQAIREHRIAHIFDEPGKVDLSHQVNFKALRGYLDPSFECLPLMNQGAFLKRLGIEERLYQLLEKATPQQKMELLSGCARLISPQYMGNIFKVLYATSLS